MNSLMSGLGVLFLSSAVLVAQNAATTAKADLADSRGKKVGTAELTQTPDGVRIGLTVSELAPGPHAGDMENIQVGSDGTGTAEIVNKQVTMGDGPNSLFHEGGTAIVIHASADDNLTDPAGNAGPRIACGVITK